MRLKATAQEPWEKKGEGLGWDWDRPPELNVPPAVVRMQCSNCLSHNLFLSLSLSCPPVLSSSDPTGGGEGAQAA